MKLLLATVIFATAVTFGCAHDAADGGGSCSDRTTTAAADVDTAAKGADRACSAASDCTLVPLGTSCSDSCSVAAVSAAGARSIAAAIQDVDARVCASFESDGCKVVALPCAAPAQSTTCVSGQCTAVQ